MKRITAGVLIVLVDQQEAAECHKPNLLFCNFILTQLLRLWSDYVTSMTFEYECVILVTETNRT